MRSLLLTIFSLALLIPFTHAQVFTSNFEELDTGTEGYWNGSDESGSFKDGKAMFYNSYNTQFKSWSGFAYSSLVDQTTEGFGNQYSTFAGEGNKGSNQFAIASTFGPVSLSLESSLTAKSVFITNSTYAALSMQKGDDFAKKFGGEDGTDPDFFRLIIKGFKDGVESKESVTFYLADYRSENNSEDYIVDTWTEVDLSTLGVVDSLSFALQSSDVGEFGMLTPAYFCIDDLSFEELPTSVANVDGKMALSVYPNPVSDRLYLDFPAEESLFWELYNISGQLVMNAQSGAERELNVSNLPSGIYTLKLQGASLSESKRILIR